MSRLVDELGPFLYARVPATVQNLLLSRHGAQLKKRRFGSAYTHWMELLSRSAYWSRAQRDVYTDEQVRRVVKRAYLHVPYYHRVMSELKLHPDDIHGYAELSRLPILSKDDIRQHGDEMIADDVERRRLLPGHTSGTTGSPLEFWWDRKVDIATNAMLWRHRTFAGLSFGRPYATLLGRLIVPLGRQRPPFWRLNRPWNQLFLSSFHLKDENLDGYLEAMAGHGTEFLEAYPSNAYLLARHLESRGRRFPLQALFTSSETLLPVQREIIEDRFQCRIFDYYGQAERVMFSGECETHRGHHQFVEYGALEVLDEQGEPAAPGREGRLVLTGFANDAMPLIRYEIGDLAAVSLSACDCGRTLPLLSTIATKAEDIVVTPDGRFLSPSVLTHPFKPMQNIKLSQIIQDSRNHLRILVVPKPAYQDQDTARLMAAFRERVGEEMEIQVEMVDKIPLGPRGKFRWVISRVQLDFAGRQVENLFRD